MGRIPKGELPGRKESGYFNGRLHQRGQKYIEQAKRQGYEGFNWNRMLNEALEEFLDNNLIKEKKGA